MKIKIISFLLCIALISHNTMILAEDNKFNTEEAFKNYVSFDDSQANKNWQEYYIVSNSNEDNSNALFLKDKQLTDFIYENIDVSPCGIAVSQLTDGIEYFGLLDDKDYTEILPVKYKSIEHCETTGYIAENIDNTKEYYIIKTSVEYEFGDIKYKETDKLYILNSYEDLKTILEPKKTPLIPIIGLDGCYILDNSQYKLIVDADRNPIVDIEFRDVDTKLSPGDTLVVWYPVGMGDSRGGVLNKNLEVIVPNNDYGIPEFIENNGIIYIKVFNVITGGEPDYYDLNWNKLDKLKESEILSNNISLKSDDSYSQWAEESIIKAIKIGLVPENIQSNYTVKITRAEFCQLAVQTYMAKTRG